MQEVDLELLRTLAGMDGYEVEERDGCLVLTNGCETFGGWYVSNDESGINEAIEQLTYNQLHPID